MLIEEIRGIRSDRRDLRNFGFVVGGVLLALASFLFWKDRPAWTWIGGIGAALVTLGAILPASLLPLQKVWMTLAVIMGWIMTRIILSVLFFLVLTPIGLIARATGKRFLERRLHREADSYWKVREDPAPGGEHYEKQY
jgi:multisubunit Na+/H+ antiporter MnhG subunit